MNIMYPWKEKGRPLFPVVGTAPGHTAKRTMVENMYILSYERVRRKSIYIFHFYLHKEIVEGELCCQGQWCGT